MPPVALRMKRRIASKACDGCRLRKVQCTFEPESSSCRRCSDSGYTCTFLKERKPRGPTARRILATATVAPCVPVGDLFIEHLCPHDIFRGILDDYLELVFPLLPLVHRPSFSALLEANACATDPAFFRLCLALCAVTVASIPRKFEVYGRGEYIDVGAMVDRACHLVLLSRISSEPGWQSRPAMNTMIVSILLAMASHYAGRANQGWGYASEAIQFFRAMELYRKEGYENLTVLQGELCKRAFWLLYFIQIHDRLSFTVPHTGLSFDPLYTDWDFLLPFEVDDQELTTDEFNSPYNTNKELVSTPSSPPVISGFVALIKVFLCVVDLLSNGFPGSPPRAYAMTSGTLRHLVYPDNPIDNTYAHADAPPSSSTISLSALLRIIRKLQSTLEELPPELQISSLDPQLSSSSDYPYMSPLATNQFDIMRGNIHITSLYIQSTILEACSNAFTTPQADVTIASPGAEIGSSPGRVARTQLWIFRKSIAKELLEVLNFCSSRILEANGSSMIVKIREIAATLLNSDETYEVDPEQDEQAREYVVQFADILANLDYMGQSTIIPPIFSAH